MDTKNRLLSVARQRLRNLPELAAQFERDLSTPPACEQLLIAAELPPHYLLGETIGHPEAAARIEAHLAGVVDCWAKAQPVPAQLPPLELQATPAATKAPKLATATDGPRAPTVHRLQPGRRDALDPIIDELCAKAADPADHAALWNAFVDLADQRNAPPPLLGFSDRQVDYRGIKGAQSIKRANFIKRLKRRAKPGR